MGDDAEAGDCTRAPGAGAAAPVVGGAGRHEERRPRAARRAWRSPAAGSLLALASAALVACGGAEEPAEEELSIAVHCVPAEARTLADARTVRGTVTAAPERSAVVSAEAPGRLDRVAVRVGDPVERGALIAEVEPRDARDVVTEARAALEEATAAREAARAAAVREQHLFERGFHARQSFEAAEAERARSAAAVTAARARLDAARHGAERTRVTAPIDGVVVHVLRSRGEVVDGTAATPIVEIADPDAPELEATAEAADLVVLRAGQDARVRFDALPDRSFDAVVRAVSPTVDRATGVGEVWLTIRCDDACPPLGLLGVAEVTVGAPENAVAIPEVAIRNGGGARTEAVICEDGRARVAEVQVARREEGLALLTSGVEPGARVAIDEVTALEDGALIEEPR